MSSLLVMAGLFALIELASLCAWVIVRVCEWLDRR